MSRTLAIVASVLGLLWLVSTGVLLFYVADLAPIQALLLAFVTMDAAFLAALALLLVTNTRRPRGVDPNAPPMRAAVDPFGQTADELREGVMLPDQRPYGRRKHDDVQVVKRLIGKFEDEDALRPPPAATPAWALDLQQEHADAAGIFPDAPLEEN